MHQTRPQTVGYGLNDSPIGLAAWITDKFWAWSDHHGDLDRSVTKDEVLTDIMIYWATQTVSSSMRIYWESRDSKSKTLTRPKTMTDFKSSAQPSPVGYASFPRDIRGPPRSWVELTRNRGPLVHWTVMPRGGHFAALEVLELLVQDVRVFFTQSITPDDGAAKVSDCSNSIDSHAVRQDVHRETTASAPPDPIAAVFSAAKMFSVVTRQADSFRQ